MLKNDTLKNGTSRIGLYGSASPGICHLFKPVQFDFEEGNFKSGFGIELLPSFAMAT